MSQLRGSEECLEVSEVIDPDLGTMSPVEETVSTLMHVLIALLVINILMLVGFIVLAVSLNMFTSASITVELFSDEPAIRDRITTIVTWVGSAIILALGTARMGVILGDLSLRISLLVQWCAPWSRWSRGGER